MATYQTLYALVFTILAAIHPLAPKAADAPVIAAGIVTAALAETEPLTESVEGDVALMTFWQFRESSTRACPKGDGGKSLGPFQIQGTTEAVACAPAEAARLWLVMAKRSVADCAALPPDERLAELASGSCKKGRGLSRSRVSRARWLLSRTD